MTAVVFRGFVSIEISLPSLKNRFYKQLIASDIKQQA